MRASWVLLGKRRRLNSATAPVLVDPRTSWPGSPLDLAGSASVLLISTVSSLIPSSVFTLQVEKGDLL